MRINATFFRQKCGEKVVGPESRSAPPSAFGGPSLRSGRAPRSDSRGSVGGYQPHTSLRRRGDARSGEKEVKQYAKTISRSAGVCIFLKESLFRTVSCRMKRSWGAEPAIMRKLTENGLMPPLS